MSLRRVPGLCIRWIGASKPSTAARELSTMTRRSSDTILLRRGGQNVFRACCVASVRTKFLDARDPDHQQKEQALIKKSSQMFEDVEVTMKNKQTYERAVMTYLDVQGKQRRGHVEFIYAAMNRMQEFQAHKDIATYRMLLDLFPKYKMKPETQWQVEMMHYPKQQQCCIDLLDAMENHGVIPDDDLGYQLIDIFGDRSHAFRKYQRMMYWLPKLRNISPYPVPENLPDNHLELAKLALKRMSVDLETVISVYQTEELEEDTYVDKTFIASSSCPKQMDLLEEHPTDQPLYVEGGFTTWLRDRGLIYFVLKSDVTQTFRVFDENKHKEVDDTLFNWSFFGDEEPMELVVSPSVHEQGDGTVLGMCITGSGSKDSLGSWIKFLAREHPVLSKVPVVFLLQTPETGIQMYQTDPQNESRIIYSSEN